jgi:2,3-dihydroxyphenylpropionate 1,2-dioxygenase
MAEIVAAALTSHAPLVTGRPDVSRPEQRDRLYAGFRELHQRLAAARPELFVMFVNDHLQNFAYSNMPAFCVGLAPSYDAPSPGAAGFLKIPARKLAGAPAVGMALLEAGFEAGIDFAYSYEIETWDEIAVPLSFLSPEGNVPVLPIYTNCAAPPLPTMRRCHAMGAFVASSSARGRCLSAWRSSPPAASRTGSARPKPGASTRTGTTSCSTTSAAPISSRC